MSFFLIYSMLARLGWLPTYRQPSETGNLHSEERTQLFVQQQQQWNSQLDVLILSASGGLEKDVLAIDLRIRRIFIANESFINYISFDFLYRSVCI